MLRCCCISRIVSLHQRRVAAFQGIFHCIKYVLLHFKEYFIASNTCCCISRNISLHQIRVAATSTWVVSTLGCRHEWCRHWGVDMSGVDMGGVDIGVST